MRLTFSGHRVETITLSSKGQLVIPKAVRQSAQLSPGGVLSVRYVDREIRLKTQKPLAAVLPTSLAEVAGCLASPARKPLGHAATEAAIRARLKARFRWPNCSSHRATPRPPWLATPNRRR